MDLTEKRLESRYVYRGKILNMRVDTVELPGGGRGTREVVEYAGAVAVVALDSDGQVLLVRQYRYPVGRTLLEIPAGKLEPGEDPETSALRELREETGFSARRLDRLLRFFSTPGFTSEEMHLFLATDLDPGEPAPDEDECVEVVRVPLVEARAMVDRGEICDAKSIIGILAACARY